MKYHKLSEVQFHEMHREFSIYLATQGITKEDWDQIKLEKPNTIDNYLNNFSDLIWEKILTGCKYMDFITFDQIYLFETKENLVNAIVLKIDSKLADLTTSKGYKKVLKFLQSDKVNLFTSSKKYFPSRNEFIYNYLKKGAIISKGLRYRLLNSNFYNSPK